MQLSLFGVDPATDEVAHFVDISLEQNTKIVGENEIVVGCKYRPTFISQLKELGILKEQTGICVIFDMIYPIYTVDFSVIKKNVNQLQELLVA